MEFHCGPKLEQAKDADPWTGAASAIEKNHLLDQRGLSLLSCATGFGIFNVTNDCLIINIVSK